MKLRDRKRVAELGGLCALLTPLFAMFSAVGITSHAVIAVLPIVTGLLGIAGIVVGCRRLAATATIAKRIIAFVLFGALISAFAVAVAYFDPYETWWPLIVCAIAFGALSFGVSRITPLNVDPWFTEAAESMRDDGKEWKDAM